eukprot:scaffold1187_cov258-Pinguiococcus_pyrenoidosus.AAC.22
MTLTHGSEGSLAREDCSLRCPQGLRVSAACLPSWPLPPYLVANSVALDGGYFCAFPGFSPNSAKIAARSPACLVYSASAGATRCSELRSGQETHTTLRKPPVLTEVVQDLLLRLDGLALDLGLRGAEALEAGLEGVCWGGESCGLFAHLLNRAGLRAKDTGEPCEDFDGPRPRESGRTIGAGRLVRGSTSAAEDAAGLT